MDAVAPPPELPKPNSMAGRQRKISRGHHRMLDAVDVDAVDAVAQPLGHRLQSGGVPSAA